jgi:aminodeoxyfutalosine synthase
LRTGVELAQASLWFGVDDLDGTVQEERIYHMAGSATPEGMTTAQLSVWSGLPDGNRFERDTLYNIVNIPAPLEAGLSQDPLTRSFANDL